MKPRQRAAIALGSNLTSLQGHPTATLRAACRRLAQHPQLQNLRCSSLYQTPPVGPPQPDYINACAVVETGLEAIALLDDLLAVEQAFGRERREHWGPRTLDLDLLFYSDQVIDHPRLQVPHPRLAERSFVLLPLSEIAPDWLHPVLNQSVAMLQTQVDCSQIRRLDGEQMSSD